MVADDTMTKIKVYFSNEKIIGIIEIIVSLFGLFIAYQLLRSILGGSWDAQNLIIGLLLTNVSVTFALAVKMAQMRSDHNNLRNQFNSLAHDFKSLREKEIHEILLSLNDLKKQRYKS